MAREIGLEEHTQVQLRVVRGVLTIEPVLQSRRKRSHRISLATYVAKITPENRHKEVDTGSPVGREEL